MKENRFKYCLNLQNSICSTMINNSTLRSTVCLDETLLYQKTSKFQTITFINLHNLSSVFKSLQLMISVPFWMKRNSNLLEQPILMEQVEAQPIYFTCRNYLITLRYSAKLCKYRTQKYHTTRWLKILNSLFVKLNLL